MWNRSYLWQRRTRLVTGVLTLCASLAGLALVAGTAPAQRAGLGARDLLAEIRTTSAQLIEVVVPADLNAREGTLVYLERDDGIAQVIGRVTRVQGGDANQATIEIRLTSPLAGMLNHGGVLKGATATFNLRDALRLLVSPDTIDKEFLLARDVIWPSVQANVLPDLIERLIRETVNEFAAPDQRDAKLLANSLASLHATLLPLEDELLDRLAKRAWDVVGIPGISAGIWRSTADGMQNSRVMVSNWWWKLFGSQANAEVVDRPFLSPETSEELQRALEDETMAFWTEHRTKIVDALSKVAVERRPEFEAAFRDRWGTLLYERAILPAWQTGQEKVLESVQVYASDFAARRLLTTDGGPRLLLAYALRSSLQISDSPLLVLAADASGAGGKIVYEPLLR